MKKGYFRVAAAVSKVNVADCDYNTDSIIEMSNQLNAQGVQLTVFPELSITGYTCGDLFQSAVLIENSDKSIARIVEASRQWNMAVVVGAGVTNNNALYNCGLLIYQGEIIAAVPKNYMPNYDEFYEKRWWSSARGINATVKIAGQRVPLTSNQIVSFNGVNVAMEVCEDLWSPLPPSSRAALAGAQVIVNLSASNDVMGKYDYLTSLVQQQSARCIAAYVYAGAGYGESTTDLVYDGKAIIAENGVVLAQNQRWQTAEQVVIADIDLMALSRDRHHNHTFIDCAACEIENGKYSVIERSAITPAVTDETLYRKVKANPFIPSEDVAEARCSEAVNIQIAGLMRRLEVTRCRHLVIGISGGLDSTLALLVAVKTFDRMGLDRKGIIGVTMPGFGTTSRTYNNAIVMMREFGVTIREISIANAVMVHFSDIGHDASVHDVTYENAQARERTQILMDIANQVGGMVLGTGDLSELALGWATYNGDHMSMYGINAGVPKTLVRRLVRWIADNEPNEACRTALLDVLDTPISPELVPAENDGTIKQKTEDLVGPYELHDFFLYYMLRYGFSPSRIYFLANKAFEGVYDKATIKHWLTTFVRRFFNQQFKRSCLPDGPKVSGLGLSPRGDWRMPSDASSALWLKECESLDNIL